MRLNTPQYTEFNSGVVAIDTDYVRPQMDASHLIVENGRAAFVDTGPAPATNTLLAVLQQCNIDPADVDYVFLTHVHLDHAGGAGQLMRELPNALAVLHPRGAPHMIDPAALVRGATAVYGEERFRKYYGTILPLEQERVLVVEDGQLLSLAGREMRCFFTEGHARHHYCLDDPASRAVFTGDSFGVSYREHDTAAGPFIFPTTTPVHFDPVQAHASVDRIMTCEPAALYLTHFSRVDASPRLADDMHRGIDDFVEIATTHANEADRAAAISRSMFDYFAERLQQHGFQGDGVKLHATLDFDIWLNTMGLEVWLDRTNKD